MYAREWAQALKLPEDWKARVRLLRAPCKGARGPGEKILAALQAAGMCNLFTQGIAALSPGLNSPGPLAGGWPIPDTKAPAVPVADANGSERIADHS
ncbi:MAG: hypothetical protein QOH06_1211 [Acidobacteriota bacterium]|jgi:hypothetical protein|nr:hypothetical protein [Acidobacteriota bacterium]